MAGSLTIDNINGKVISSSPVATESQVIGVGQTWQDVTGSRVAGTTYTNSTGKPIVLSLIGATTGTNGSINAIVDGLPRFISQYGTSGYNLGSFAIIPANSTYSVTIANATISRWSELR